MENTIPMNVDLNKALEQINGTIENESAKWAGRLAEKVGAEENFVEKVFSEEETSKFEKAARFLNGKDQRGFASAYAKLSVEEKDAYDTISAYRITENMIHNAREMMNKSAKKILACVEVKKIIEAAIAAKK